MDNRTCFQDNALTAIAFASNAADLSLPQRSRDGSLVIAAYSVAQYLDCLEEVDKQTKPIYK